MEAAGFSETIDLSAELRCSTCQKTIILFPQCFSFLTLP
jgi:hypothetical protein